VTRERNAGVRDYEHGTPNLRRRRQKESKRRTTRPANKQQDGRQGLHTEGDDDPQRERLATPAGHIISGPRLPIKN